MEVARLILEYIEALSYPGLIVFALLLFRRELALALQGTLKAQYKELTITLERTQKQMQVAEQNREQVAEGIERELEHVQMPDAIQDRDRHLENVRRYLKVFVGHYEGLVVAELRKKPEGTTIPDLVERITGDSDPWRRDRDAEQVRDAIEQLLASGVLRRNPEGDTVQLHEMFKT